MRELASVGLVCTLHDDANARAVAESAALVVVWSAPNWTEADKLLMHETPRVILVSRSLLDQDASVLRRFAGLDETPLLGVIGANETRPSEATMSASLPFRTLLTAAHASLGRVGVKEAQKALRLEMFRAALHQSHGNRHAAARLLRVDRRYVLKMLKEDPELDCDQDARFIDAEQGRSRN